MPSLWTFAPALMALYVALNALVALVLSMMVSRARVTTGVDGTHPAIARASSAFTASAQYLPIPLLMMLIATSLGAATWLIHAIGAPLTLGQVMHGIGASRSEGASGSRFAGNALIWISYIAGIAALIWLVFARQAG